MFGEFLLFQKLQPVANRTAVFFMCLAAFAAAMTDTTLTLPGVLWVLLCAVSTAGYLLLMKTLQNDPQNKMGDAAMLIVNNCCALPLMLVSWAFSGEIQLLPQCAPPRPTLYYCDTLLDTNRFTTQSFGCFSFSLPVKLASSTTAFSFARERTAPSPRASLAQ